MFARGLRVSAPVVTLMGACAAHGSQVVTPLDPTGPAGDGELVQVRALADVERVGPGQTFHLAVVFDLQPQWHIYWKNPGEGALPPRVVVEAPDGFTVAAPLWPRPTAVSTPVGSEYCYYEQMVLFVPITAPAELAAGRVTLKTTIDWAVCKHVCKLGSARREVVVETASRPWTSCDEPDPVLARHRRRLPRKLDELAGAAVSFDGTTLTIIGPAGDRQRAAFFPNESPGVTYDEPEIEVAGGRFSVSVAVELRPHNALDQPMVLGGLVALGDRSDDPSYDFQLPLSIGATK
jgi:thiol:disulfide interchange protein DsbD